MELGLKLAAGAAAAALCAVCLRRTAPEFSVVIAVAAGAWLLLNAAGVMTDVVHLMGRLAGLASVGQDVFLPVIRVVGLSILTHVTGELCRSAGEGGIAAVLQTAGTMLALAAAAPLIASVLELVAEMTR